MVDGRLSVRANMRPYLSVFGTRRVIGIASPDGAIIMPAELVDISKNGIGRQAIGSFKVCPVTRRRPGVMQLGCIAQANRLRIREESAAEGRENLPSVLLAESAARGPRAVVDRLWNAPATRPGGAWASVEEHVALGSTTWLAVAEALAPGTDAGASHGLNIALHHALTRNPTGVLKLLRQRPERAQFVCADGNDEATPQAAVADLRAAVAAVVRVRASDLQAQRVACLTALRGALAASPPEKPAEHRGR